MDPFHSSKRSSVSFGGNSARTTVLPTTYEYSPIDSLQYGSGSAAAQDAADPAASGQDGFDASAGPASSSSMFYTNRSPMYSPLEFGTPSFTPLQTMQQQQQSRGYNLMPGTSPAASAPRQNTVCEWDSPSPLYALDWSPDDLVCLGTYKEDSRNKLQVIRSQDQLSWDKVSECSTTYPVSKVQWLPGSLRPRQLATCSDSLRIWSLNESDGSLAEQVNLSLCKYNKQHNNGASSGLSTSTSNSGSGSSADKTILGGLPPITSFDWNKIETNLIISCSIDTTCIVWDLNSSNFVKTQLIAHDSEVYDVSFLTKSTQVFASCGGDGSVRIFDLRSLAHSTIIYEPPQDNTVPPSLDDPTQQNHALLRLEPSPFDPNILATFVCDSNSIMILDMRNPESPVLTLDGHAGSINQIKWHPTKRNVLMSCADDCQVLCWDLNKSLDGSATAGSRRGSAVQAMSDGASSAGDYDMTSDENDKELSLPSFHYRNQTEEVNNIVWRPDSGNWLGTVSGKKFKNIRVY
ncbi:hypothetical protein DAKH74_025280 [Maudiozyma humilis]|uniref:Uncharacterized protein n=1 Tax=Maudiozyma humilis TaxID=51915 RepID=A0AAV5RYW4_MAUHU|nr:hypothetical protein DAKH74_025280 [Kazachstania humilis]